MREPDWQALADLQFILYNRIAGSLNEALSGIALSDMPEAQDKPPGFWKERATNKIANVVNLFTAWSYLIRYKMGEAIPERAIRPFHANDLLAWLGAQLQINPPPQIESNPELHANQETLQEALLLLYSVAFTQGAGVRLELEASRLGMWFRLKFSRTQSMPPTIDELLASLGDHWRAQDTGFELATARDFVQLNGAELMLNSSSTHGEFMFFVRSAGAPKKKAPPPPLRSEVPPPQTRPLSPEALNRMPEETGISLETGKVAAVELVPAPKPDVPEPAAPETVDTAADVDTPVITQAFQLDETPVFMEMQIGQPPHRETSAPPPSMLHPLPPAFSQLQRQLVAREDAENAEAGRNGDSPSGEPDANGQTSPPPDTEHAAADLQPAETPPLPTPSKRSTDSASVIIPVKIPGPVLPTRLTPPPATTSNSAVTRQTQTLSPVKRESTPTPTGDQEDTVSAPPDAATTPAPDSNSRKESP